MRAPNGQVFERLLAIHAQGLYGAAMRWTRNPADAEDLVQDTCLRAYRFFHLFRPGSSFRAWITTILRNVARNQYRGRLSRGTLISLDEVEHRLATGGTSGRPDRRQGYERQDLRAALDRLPHRYRVLLQLVDVEGLTYDEAAQKVSCPIGTVMSRLYRARRRLRRELSPTSLKAAG